MSTPVEKDSGMPNLMAGLEAYYDRGSFLVEMQLDWYTIYVRRHDSGQQRTRSEER
ncbi:hypothetical protein FOYG_17611 [Fusarium oxysporum NRRL 32931]|uniref:Uncharacterized protein n=1 Tax=Fusarium oxysporum NRRL 32931 TaxID=660029 RepID=W9H9F6_FUSOX|nr:hypothetical protein FOYG_17611 [Fusarium oxysporum NRRL 32931]